MILLLCVLFTRCNTGHQENVHVFTPEKALYFFQKIEDACNRDNGRLLGANIYGPLMMLDRSTRQIYTNVQDEDKLLKERSGVYVGLLPRNAAINNEFIKYGSTRFTLLILPGEADESKIIMRGIYNLFHIFLSDNGCETSVYYNTFNMDEKNARLWLKLEWKALKKALTTQGAEKQFAIRDALIFRGVNHELYSKYVNDKIQFEYYEGFASFVCMKFAFDYPDEYFNRLFSTLDRIYSFKSFSRSYGSILGALYATLAYQKGFDFSTILKESVDLSKIVQDLYDIEMPAYCRDVAGSIAINYDISKIREEEDILQKNIKESLQEKTNTFLKNPVIIIDLESPYFDYDPSKSVSLGRIGTIYKDMHISDNWGKLVLEQGEGCLISYDFKQIRIPATDFKIEKNRIYGKKWCLTLNNNRKVEKILQDYYVRKIKVQ